MGSVTRTKYRPRPQPLPLMGGENCGDQPTKEGRAVQRRGELWRQTYKGGESCGELLIQFRRDELLGILKVFDGVELTGEEVADVEHLVGMPLAEQPLEGQFVEFVL